MKQEEFARGQEQCFLQSAKTKVGGVCSNLLLLFERRNAVSLFAPDSIDEGEMDAREQVPDRSKEGKAAVSTQAEGREETGK